MPRFTFPLFVASVWRASRGAWAAVSRRFDHARTPLWALLLAACAATGGCGKDNGDAPAESEARRTDGLVVVASIHPVADLAAALLGDRGEVHTLLPAGATPHGFSPTPQAMVRLARADLLLTVGRGLDPWAEALAQRMPDPPTILRFADVAAPPASDAEAHHHEAHEHEARDHGDHDHPVHDHGDEDHDHHAGHDHADHAGHDHFGPNPHLWLDPVAVRRYVETLADALAERLPGAARAGLAARRDALLAEVDEVDAAYRAAVEAIPHRRLITFHNAFDPLAERYGLEVVAHLTPIELGAGGEVTPHRLRAAIRAIETHGVPALYVEPQFNDAVARRLAERTGVRVLTLDPLGHPRIAERATWPELMRFNLRTLKRGQADPAPGSTPGS